ncbi:hypothetical protein HYPDE_23678 [Hyphomicrobium denitrificans 1NES1]|uniref:Uncharacterized protein n=1 Tax=Hyphomicrobium denitrificans 1NES1 TaxID=670307 RepID=N0B7A7_9HYPH|nr:hypothetical protein [Hyphomicrobium denitrificans]AGK56421.1 hypothetical protein HYPDE_23678 [Hyphomicrobium denitrificans 1NES1]
MRVRALAVCSKNPRSAKYRLTPETTVRAATNMTGVPSAIIASFNVILSISGRRDTANDSQFREENDATNVRNR